MQRQLAARARSLEMFLYLDTHRAYYYCEMRIEIKLHYTFIFFSSYLLEHWKLSPR